MLVLLVDDDRLVLDFLQAFFESLEHDVIALNDPSGALKTLITKKPDLVLLDIMMPGKDGLQLLKEMKDIDKEVSIALITAYRDAERIIEAFRLGAIDCLLKPFNIDYIVSSVLPRVRLRKR